MGGSGVPGHPTQQMSYKAAWITGDTISKQKQRNRTKGKLKCGTRSEKMLQ